MKKFGMMCTCGDMMTVDAENREEAVKAMRVKMEADGADHMAKRHPGEPMMDMEMMYKVIEKEVKEV